MKTEAALRRGPAARARLQAVIAQREWRARQADLARAQVKRLQAMEACVEAGWTMAGTAELFGVTRGYVSNVIANRQGKGVAPSEGSSEG